MRWFKVAALGVGILIALIVGFSVVGFVVHAVIDLVIAALVVGGIVVAIKMSRSGKQVSRKRADREVRGEEPDYSRPRPRADVEPVAPSYQAQSARQNPQDIDDELARLKREMGA